MIRQLRHVLAWLFLMSAVAGCGADAPAAPAETGDVPATSVPSSSAELAALKRASGIADCPRSDPNVAARPDGLPDLTIPCLGGGRDVRLAGLRGRPMLINAWAQWCPPCREESPYLAEVSGAPSDLLILGIDYADPRPDYAIEFASLAGWRYPQLVDPEKVLEVPLKLSAGPPQTLFVSADGKIVHRHAGPFESATEIRQLTKRHLGVRW